MACRLALALRWEERVNEGGRPNAREEALLTAWLQRGREQTREGRPSLREESSSSHSLLRVRAGGAGRHKPSVDVLFGGAQRGGKRKIWQKHWSAPVASAVASCACAIARGAKVVLMHRAGPRLYDGPVAAAKAHIRFEGASGFHTRGYSSLERVRLRGAKERAVEGLPAATSKYCSARSARRCRGRESRPMHRAWLVQRPPSRRARLRARPSLWPGALLASSPCPRRQVAGTLAVAKERPGRQRQRFAGGRLTRQPAAPPSPVTCAAPASLSVAGSRGLLALRGLAAPGRHRRPRP